MTYIRFFSVLYWFAPFLKFEPLPSENPRCAPAECIKDLTNFEKTIKKQKVITSATQLKKYKIKGDEKGEIKTMMCDLFRSILLLSKKKLTWQKF